MQQAVTWATIDTGLCLHIYRLNTWWRHEMETFSALLAICAGNSPDHGEFPAQRPVTRSFDVFFDLRLNKRLSKQSWGWWFETPSRPLWRHRIMIWSFSTISRLVPPYVISERCNHFLRRWLASPVPCHCFNLCYLIVNWTPWKKLQRNLNQNAFFLYRKWHHESFMRKMSAILFRLQYVKYDTKTLFQPVSAVSTQILFS